MMKSKVVSLFLVAAIIFLPVVNTLGQSAEEAQIKQYREEIQRLAAKTPPPEAQDAHRKALMSLRKKLRDLLVEKRGALKKDIRDLQSTNASTELQDYVKQLEAALGSVDGEVQVLDRALEQDSSIASVNPSPSPVTLPVETEEPPAATGESPSSDAERTVARQGATTGAGSGTETVAERQQRESFEKAVSSFSPEELREAAAPPEVAETKLPEPGCNDRGRPISTTFSKLDEFICRLSRNVNLRRDRRILLSRDQAAIFSILIAKLLKTKGDESFVSFIADAQEARTDQQLGAGPSNSGSTSLVTKGGVPFALALAVENGALVQSRSGTTYTFRLNPVGAINALANNGFITSFRRSQQDPVLNLFRKSSVGFSFDTSRGDQPGVFTGDEQQLSAITARYEFFNERDPRHPAYEAEWEQFVANDGVKLAEQIWATTLALNDFGTRTSNITFKDPALQAWLDQTNGLIAASGPDVNEIERIIRDQADLLPVGLVTEETVDAVTNFARQFQAYTKKKNEILDRIAKGRVFTFEYTNQREVNAPDTSNFNFIFATGTGRRIDLTANGSITLFNKRQPAASLTEPRPKRVRDFQFAAQADVPFTLGNAGQFVLWFSGRYERLLENASTQDGTIIPSTKGDIAVGQFGLKIPIKSLGIQFPISFTVANRTELIREREVRGNFGFTFNLDTLFARFKPF